MGRLFSFPRVACGLGLCLLHLGLAPAHATMVLLQSLLNNRPIKHRLLAQAYSRSGLTWGQHNPLAHPQPTNGLCSKRQQQQCPGDVGGGFGDDSAVFEKAGLVTRPFVFS